jgi:hypothetical protein
MASGKGIQIIVGAEFNGKDLDRAEAKIRSMRAQVDKSAGSMKSFGAELKRSFSTGSIIAAAAVTAFAVKSVQAFSQVEDAQSALSSTFGSTGDNLVTWANETAIAFNLSRREALQAAQTMAVFGDSAGLAGKDLEQFSVTLTERAADAASFFGGSTQEAITAFGAALRGENEPIRRYGVLLDDATLRAKALELGLVSTTKNALTPQQKTLAAYNVIMEQTTRVQGDVERTSDSMANQIKKAQAEFDNFQVAVGETVAVAVKPLIESLNTVLGFFNGLPGPMKTASVAVVAIGAAALIVVPKILAVRTAFLQMQTAAVASGKKSSLALMGMTKAAGRATIALAAVAVAGQTWASTSEDGQAYTLENAYATDEYARALRDIIQPGAGGSFGNVIAGISDALVPHNTQLDDAKTRVAEFDKQLVELVSSGDAEGAKRLYEDLTAGASQYGATTDEVLALLPGYTEALEQSAEAVALAGESSSTAAPKIDILAGSQRRAKRAAEGLAGALDGVEAALARQAAMQSYREAMAEFVATPTTETAAAVIAAMTEAADSFDKPKKQAKFVDAAISDVKQVAQDADLKLKPYLEDSLTRAQRKAQDVKAAIDAIPTAKTVNIYYKQHSRQIPDATESASGGLVTGRAGAPRQDNLPFMLSRGEFVVQASAVKRFGAPFFEALNAGVRPLAEMGSAASATTSTGLTINGGITVQSAPGERAETSLPRALRRAAFLAGVNG